MLVIKLIAFVVLWSTIYADYDDDNNFERICVPNEVCYLVSKFKTSYREARHICREKLKGPQSHFNERDKIILKPLSDQVRRHKYWIEGSSSQTVRKVHRKFRIRFRIRLLGYRRRGATRLFHVKNIKIRRLIIGIMINYANVLKKIQWGGLLDFIELRRRSEIVRKIRRFVSIVENEEFGNLDLNFIKFMTDVIMKLKFLRTKQLIESSDDDSRLQIIVEHALEYIRFLKLLGWEELVSNYDDTERLKITGLIETFIRYAENKDFGRIDIKAFSLVSKIATTLTKLKLQTLFNYETQELNRRAKIEAARKFLLFLGQINWEEFIEQFEESKRDKIIAKIRRFIKLVQDEEYDKININFITFINRIIAKFGILRIRFIFNLRERFQRQRVLLDTSRRFIRLLEELNWAGHMKYFDEDSRAEVIERIRTFISLVQRKKLANINFNLLTFINQIINKLGLIKVRDSCDCETREHEDKVDVNEFLKYVKILISLRWENYLKFFQELERTEIVEKIRNFIRLVENKEFDKIDGDLYHFIINIVLRLKTAKEQNNKVDVKDDKVIKFIELIKFLQAIKWEILVKDFEESRRAEIIEKIRNFIQLVQNKEFDKISANLHDFITLIIVKFKNLKERHAKDDCVIENKHVRCEKIVSFLEQIKWEDLVKYFEESQRSEIIEKVRAFIRLVQNKEFDNIKTDMHEYIVEIVKQFKKIKEDRPKVDAENAEKVAKFDQFLKFLDDIKWEELLQSFEESKRLEIIEKIKRFRELAQNKEYQNIDNTLYLFITEIIVKLKEIKQATVDKTVTKETINKIQLTLPSNWVDLIKRISGIDQNLWIERITQLLARKDSKDYQEIKFDWIGELQNIIGLISQENLKFKKENALSEQSIADLTEKINRLKEWKWDTLVIYLSENNRQQVKEYLPKIISAVENKQFDQINTQSLDWLNGVHGVFSKITGYMKDGYSYNTETKTWVKKVVKYEDQSRVKRLLGLRIGLNLGRHHHHHHRPRYPACTYIENEDDRLITKYARCEKRQRFICKRQINE